MECVCLWPHRRIQQKRPAQQSWSFGPSGESRTHGLLNPIQARYQTALHPDSYCRAFAHSNLFSITHVFTKVNSYLKFTAKLFSYCRAKIQNSTKKTSPVELVFWSEWRESNSRPLEPHSSALPNCATPGCQPWQPFAWLPATLVIIFALGAKVNTFFDFFLQAHRHFFFFS